jgi:hypothetical protein
MKFFLKKLQSCNKIKNVTLQKLKLVTVTNPLLPVRFADLNKKGPG